MLNPFVINKGEFTLTPFMESDDSIQLAQIILEGLPDIFLNKEVLEYSPEQKKIGLHPDIYLLNTIKNYQNESEYDFFLINNTIKNLAGLIKFIAPETLHNMYPFIRSEFEFAFDANQNVWGIEFFLRRNLWGQNIMRYFVNQASVHLLRSGVHNILAFTDPKNLRSEGLLQKCHFEKIIEYNDKIKEHNWNLWHLYPKMSERK